MTSLAPAREAPMTSTETVAIVDPCGLVLPGVDPCRLAADDTLFALGNRDVVRRYWMPDGTGVNPHGFVGEDAEASSAVRFVNRYAPCAMITVNFHVVDLRERSNGHPAVHPAPFIVEEVIEYLLAHQPIVGPGSGGDVQAVWTDSTFAYASPNRMATRANAEAERDAYAHAEAARGVGDRFVWNAVHDSGLSL